MEKAIYNADFIIPASMTLGKAAGKIYFIRKRIKLTDKAPDKFRNGTLGATEEQVIEGVKRIRM